MNRDTTGSRESIDPLVHIVNLERGSRLPCIDESGEVLAGIHGLEGVSGMLPDGTEVGIDSIEMESGASFAPHVHDGAHILVVTAGVGELVVGGQRYVLRPGDSVFVPADLPHAMGSQPANLLHCVSWRLESRIRRSMPGTACAGLDQALDCIPPLRSARCLQCDRAVCRTACTNRQGRLAARLHRICG